MAFSDLVATTDNAVRAHLGSVSVVYQPQVGGPVNVTGIFDENYVLVEAGELGVEQVTPAVWLDLGALPVHPDNDEPLLTISGRVYRVRERQPDGMNTIRLLLHRADV